MPKQTWRIVAILSCAYVALAAAVCTWYFGVLIATSANVIFAVIGAALIGESLARKVLVFMTWWWPEQASPDWISKHPPMFRFDRLKRDE